MAGEIKRIRRTQLIRSGFVLTVFVIVNFVLRAAIIWINEAEYTDGVLQVTQFRHPTGIWPPLYTAICWPLSLLIGELWSGRTVSTIFSALAVIPIFLLARRCFGVRPAMFAALMYTVAPTSLRWAPRLMTEATFSFFFWFALERLMVAQGAKTKEEADGALVWAGLLGLLASLTRYQGLLLILPALYIPISLRYYRGFLPLKGMSAVLLYALVPLWSMFYGNIHGEQFSQRSGGDPWAVFVGNAEPFLLYMPYFLTYPVAVLVWVGLIKGRARPRHMMLPMTLYVLAVLLVTQSMFSSFQERYFLPFFGLLYIWAGLGMAIQDHLLRRKASPLRNWVPLLVVVWCLYVSTMVLMGSRGAFGDIAAASRFAAGSVNDAKSRLYTNESYRLTDDEASSIVATKAEFFAKRDVTYLDEDYFRGRKRLAAGDLLILSDVYGGDAVAGALSRMYELQPVIQYESRVLPVFPDIMADRLVLQRSTGETTSFGLGQNPLAWFFRYQWQSFRTVVYRVEGPRSP